MSTPNPLTLTGATRFQPVHLRGHSRSPSRSPLRKSQFAARELDPLLSNLSPDSTLKALQATATITGDGNGQDALAKSIVEASPSDREIGIRAAVAGQKLKQWYQEVTQWPWPGRRDRSWGAGFLPPQKDLKAAKLSTEVPYLGSLPTASIDEYQNRIEDIRDGIEALELEDIKEHIFSAHIPSRVVSASHTPEQSPSSKTLGYGRMKDFTALITATVIQALPDMANLNMLLDTWDIRLSILRQIPDIAQSFTSTQAGLRTANAVVHNSKTGPLVTREECDMTKAILGENVSALGAKIDKLLDLLEGQEDTLPKVWIDTLENIENDYATWVVEAEHIVIRNDLLQKALSEQYNQAIQDDIHEQFNQAIQDDIHEQPNVDRSANRAAVHFQANSLVNPESVSLPKATPLAELPGTNVPEFLSQSHSDHEAHASKQPHLIVQPSTSSHRRGVSEVSMAESAFSAMSGLSTAEIVDARSTEVVTGPKINLVQNPFRASRDELSLLTASNLDGTSNTRPPMIQRASTTSIEVFLKDQVKEVVLTRSRSQDMLSQLRPASPEPSTPAKALQQLGGEVVETNLSPEPLSPISKTTHEKALSEQIVSAPLSLNHNTQTQPGTGEIKTRESPEVPRRSSKRLSANLQISTAPGPSHSPIAKTPEQEIPPGDQFVTPVRQIVDGPHESLEDRIKDILSTIPTKIRLSKEPDDDEHSQTNSITSTRSSTPMPSLTLSPAKVDRTSRQAAPGDVRVFHLTRSGQSRDAPPVKLFVRAVGENGERVMVRVGGGWADLAEYLKEYSLHHGHRGLAGGQLEVASYPAAQTVVRDTPSPPSNTTSTTQVTHDGSSSSASKRKSLPGTSNGAVDLPPLTVNKLRKNGRGKSLERPDSVAGDNWTPPPVPPIPATYTTQTPTTVVTTTDDGVTSMSTLDPPHSLMHNGARAVSTPVRLSNNGQSTITHTSTTTPPSVGAKYTPLGAAGPKSGGRRAATHHSPSSAHSEAWVEGMVGKARAVSNGTTVVQGPTTTTTTTVISRSTPSNRRASAFASLSPASSTGAASPSSSVSKTSPALGPALIPAPARPKSRMSIGDVSGIKRVFLRRKSDK